MPGQGKLNLPLCDMTKAKKTRIVFEMIYLPFEKHCSNHLAFISFLFFSEELKDHKSQTNSNETFDS